MIFDGFGVGDNGVREIVSAALDEFLRAGFRAGFAFGGDARRNLRDATSEHSENVRVKIVRLDQINFIFAQKLAAARELASHIRVVKRAEPEFGNFRKTEPFDLAAQNARAVQTGDENPVRFILVQKPDELDSLALGAARTKTADELENVFFHLKQEK